MQADKQITELLYQPRIKTCDETERRILFLINTCHEYFIKINKPCDGEEFGAYIKLVE